LQHQQEHFKFTPKNTFEDEKYIYYYDLDNKLKKILKNYEKRPGYIRLKFLEAPYRFWRYRSPDGRNAIIPVFLSIISGYGLYSISVYFSEWEASFKEKALVPVEFSEKSIK
jgi:hypothetical protein